MISPDRRLAIRKPLARLTYLGLGPTNGGIVVDVSEGGVGFQSIAPLHAKGPIQFRFAIDSGTRIAAVGELAWKDATGKNGGLRFTYLPDTVREQIRGWIADAHPAAAGTLPKMNSAFAAPVVPARPGNRSLISLAYGEDSRISSRSLSRLKLANAPEGPLAGKSVPSVLGVTIALALVASVGICSYLAATGTGEKLVAWAEKMWAESATPAQQNTENPAAPYSTPNSAAQRNR